MIELIADDAVAGETMECEVGEVDAPVPVIFQRLKEVRPGWYVDATTVWGEHIWKERRDEQ